MKNNNQSQNSRQLLISIAIVIGVIVLGMACVYYTLGFFYRAAFLMRPCDLCGLLNEDARACLEVPVETTLYSDGSGNWYAEGDYLKEQDLKINYTKFLEAEELKNK